MPLTSGTRLGPYEIVAPIGAGGMGEVYRAKDTRLDRTVAIKVLASHLSSDPELRQRLDREAKSISVLQHPNICTLYDVGSQDDVGYLVMECLEGQTLADRLTKGPLPLAQVISIGIEIAQALEKAHAAGITHRDLKPANIMLTKSGTKLMDFGLAKPQSPLAQTSASLSSSSPTIQLSALTSAPSPLTQKGAIVGTCQYLAPEVLQGQEADARSDIFSFGCVLYEMTTGKRAFEAKSQLGVLTAILEKEPEPIRTLQPLVPTALDRIITACLAKDPADRIQSAHDIALDLRWAGDSTGTAAKSAAPRSNAFLATIAAAAAALIIAAGLAGYWWANHTAPIPQFRAEIAPPDNFIFDSTGDAGGMPVISPQGNKIAFVAHSADTKMLFVRSLDADTATPINGTQNAIHPFWSPDGKYVGFFSNGKLRKVLASGGSVVPLADVASARGGAWGANDVIVYCPNIIGGLFQVSANGGTATPATVTGKEIPGDTHRWPWFLPDGKHFLFLAISHTPADFKAQGIYYGSLDSPNAQLLVTTDSAAQYASGYLLYHQASDLVAQPFDPANGKLSGQPVPLINNIRNDSGVWRPVFSASQNGTLLYEAGSATAAGSHLAWFDRSGKQLEHVTDHEATVIDLRLSPDGKFAAVALNDGIWVLDLARKTRNRLTFGGGLAEEPAFSPDGKSVVYATGMKLIGAHVANGNSEIHSASVDGTAPDKLLAKVAEYTPLPTWSPDGKYLLYLAQTPGNVSALWIAPANGDGPARILVTPPTPDAILEPYRVSPDGRWLAYTSTESGQQEIYLTTFPEAKGKWRVSTDAGAYPAWSADSKQLFYKDLTDTFFVSTVSANGNVPDISVPQKLFHAAQPGLGIGYDVSPDGQRLLVNLSEDEVMTPLKIVTNWPALLKK
jgi:serine/threonine protein kinase/WD40 repeat protein